MGKPRPRNRARIRAAKEKRKKVIVVGFGLFMAFLMVFSVASYVVFNPTGGSDLEYGEYEFRYEESGAGGGSLVTEVNGQRVEFQNLPLQVAHLEVDPLAMELIESASQVAMSADPSLEQYQAQIVDYARFQLALAIPKMASTITKPDSRYNLPVLNCTTASAQTPVLVFNITNETASLSREGYCLTVNGEQRTLLQMKDRIIFEYIGILENGTVVDE